MFGKKTAIPLDVASLLWLGGDLSGEQGLILHCSG